MTVWLIFTLRTLHLQIHFLFINKINPRWDWTVLKNPNMDYIIEIYDTSTQWTTSLQDWSNAIYSTPLFVMNTIFRSGFSHVQCFTNYVIRRCDISSETLDLYRFGLVYICVSLKSKSRAYTVTEKGAAVKPWNNFSERYNPCTISIIKMWSSQSSNIWKV